MSMFQNILMDCIAQIKILKHHLDESLIPYQLEAIVIHPELLMEFKTWTYNTRQLLPSIERLIGYRVIVDHDMEKYDIRFVLKSMKEEKK